MKTAPTVTAVNTWKLRFGFWAVAQVAALGSGSCSSAASDRADDVGAASSPQVKPASSRVATAREEVIAEPEPEAAELPRGVSAPQPSALDEQTERASAALPGNKPSPKPKPVQAAAAPPSAAPPKPVAPKPAAPPAMSASKPAPPKPRAVPPAPPVQQPIAPAPIAEAPPTPPKAAAVVVPHTEHVRVEVPAGLQHWLDEDDRMRPWLSKAVNVADSCYAKVRADNASAAGVIAFVVTMHENARPSGSVSSVSSQVSGIVMCATTRLLGVKMPLFTGKEGQSYTVRVHFEP